MSNEGMIDDLISCRVWTDTIFAWMTHKIRNTKFDEPRGALHKATLEDDFNHHQ